MKIQLELQSIVKWNLSLRATRTVQWQFSQFRLGNRAICSSFPSQIVMSGGIKNISLMCRQFALN